MLQLGPPGSFLFLQGRTAGYLWGAEREGKNIPSNAKRCHVKMETITIIGGWDDNLFLNCMCVCA